LETLYQDGDEGYIGHTSSRLIAASEGMKTVRDGNWLDAEISLTNAYYRIYGTGNSSELKTTGKRYIPHLFITY